MSCRSYLAGLISCWWLYNSFCLFKMTFQIVQIILSFDHWDDQLASVKFMSYVKEVLTLILPLLFYYLSLLHVGKDNTHHWQTSISQLSLAKHLYFYVTCLAKHAISQIVADCCALNWSSFFRNSKYLPGCNSLQFDPKRIIL